MSRNEFLEWAIPQYRTWFSQHSDIKPSIDRIDSDGHYELGNIRLLSLDENRQNGYRVNRHAPVGTLWCPRCRSYKPKESFTVDRQKKTGRCTYCRSCLHAYKKQRLQTP